MIRINLLPVRAAKKKEYVRFQLTVAALLTFLTVAVSLMLNYAYGSDVVALQGEIDLNNDELRKLKAKLGDLTKLEAQKATVQKKLDAIKQLEASRSGPIALLQELSETIPKNAWITDLKESGKAVKIKGLSDNEEVVSEFMKALEVRWHVRLIQTTLMKAPVKGRTLIEFELNLTKK